MFLALCLDEVEYIHYRNLVGYNDEQLLDGSRIPYLHGYAVAGGPLWLL
jgi:hypothetical protein